MTASSHWMEPLSQTCDLPLEPGPDGLLRSALSMQRPDGQWIRGILTLPRTPARSLVMIAAGLGRTIRHSTFLSLVCARHGYGSLRFDLANHSGDSDGDVSAATFTSGVEDFWAVAAALRERGWCRPLFTVASSIAARSAVRAAKEGLPVDGLVLLLPVVDFEKTMVAAIDENLADAYRAGRIRREDPVRVLTHDVSGCFIADAVEGGFCGLAATRDEIAQATVPLAAVVAEDDDWVQAEDVAAALQPNDSGRLLFVLEKADHDSYSFGFMRGVARATVHALARILGDEVDLTDQIGFPELVEGLRIEKPLLKRARAVWTQAQERRAG